MWSQEALRRKRAMSVPASAAVPGAGATSDRDLFARRAPYVEFWAHMASFIPAADWGLFRFRMDETRAKYGAPGGWYHTHREIVDWVRSELADRGPLRPAQIEHDAHQGDDAPPGAGLRLVDKGGERRLFRDEPESGDDAGHRGDRDERGRGHDRRLAPEARELSDVTRVQLTVDDADDEEQARLEQRVAEQ